jgi:hypothetical protein
MQVESDAQPVYIVCNRATPNRRPGAPSAISRCRYCRALVWVARETIETAIRREIMKRSVLICVPCARPLMSTVTGVIAADGASRAETAAAATSLGVAEGTPVIGGAGGAHA